MAVNEELLKQTLEVIRPSLQAPLLLSVPWDPSRL